MLNAIFVMGPPGSGKTLLSATIAKRFDFGLFQGGRLLRQIAASPSSQSQREAVQILCAGRPIPVTLYCDLVAAETAIHRRSIAFDGYPRDLDQCIRIPDVLRAAHIPYAAVLGLFLSSDPDTISTRLASRSACKNCGSPGETTECCQEPDPQPRADDRIPELIQRRMLLYSSNIAKIRSNFTDRWTVMEIDPEQINALEPLSAYINTGRI
jgi:adenylate kinase family enzyme